MATKPLTTTLGQAIIAARKLRGISQKDLAAAVQKEDGSGSISPQYLNDIEHDRRSPTSDELIKAIAHALDENPDDFFVLAGKIPEDLRTASGDSATRIRAFKAFRRELMK